MHILIIGCGYLGLRAAKLWLEQGARVSALTRSAERARELADLGISPIIGDVTDWDSLQQLPAADVCLYAVGYDRTAAIDKRTVYVNGAVKVFSAISGKVSRLIYVSSTSVYGQDAGEIVDEDSPVRPTEPGGQICFDAEIAVHIASRRSNLWRSIAIGFFPRLHSVGMMADPPHKSLVILRLAGIYGPGRLIGRSEQLRQGQPLTGNPQAWLNLIHVDDAAAVAVMLAQRPDITGVRLLCDEQPLRRAEFYSTFADLIGAPRPAFASEGEGGLNKRCDSSQLRRELGFTLRYPDAHSGLRQALGLE